MKRKNWLAAALAGSMVFSLVACGSDTASTDTAADTDAAADAADTGAASGEGYKLSMVLKTQSAEFWRIIQAGAEAYAEEHPDLVAELSIKGPPSETAYEEQLNMLETDLNVPDFDGYMIAPLQSEAVATKLEATDKPVIAFDTNVESDKRVSFVGTGNKEAAKMGAVAAVEAAKAAGWEDIQCIEIAGVQGDATNTARMEGYKEGIEESGGDFLEDEVQYANATADLAVTCMEAIMSKYPEGVAIICSNNDDMAVAAARTAKANPNYANTIFVGFDGQESACQAVLDGDLTMTIAQNNYEIGYQAVDTMVKVLQGEDVPEFVDTGCTIITKENAQERLDKISGYLK